MHCPELNICLRNSQAILNFSLKYDNYYEDRYETLGQRLDTPNNINVGMFKDIRLPLEKVDTSLEVGLKHVPRRIKTLIIDDACGKLPSYGAPYTLERKCCIIPQMDQEVILQNYPHIFVKHSDEDLIRWMDEEEETESYLVMCTEYRPKDRTLSEMTSSLDYSGYEVKSMIYIYRHCPDCETGHIRTSLITRAKSSLVAIQLRVLCLLCLEKKHLKEKGLWH